MRLRAFKSRRLYKISDTKQLVPSAKWPVSQGPLGFVSLACRAITLSALFRVDSDPDPDQTETWLSFPRPYRNYPQFELGYSAVICSPVGNSKKNPTLYNASRASPTPPPPAPAGDPSTCQTFITKFLAPSAPQKIRSSSASYDRHDLNAPTTPAQYQQRQHSRIPSSSSRPLFNQTQDPIERLSTPRSLRRTPKFDAPPSPAPEPRKFHRRAASLGFEPRRTVAPVDDLPESHPTVLGLVPVRSVQPQAPRLRRRLSQDLTEDPDEVSSEHPPSPPRRALSVPAHYLDPHPVLKISKHTHSAILFALEEALRNPNPFTPDLEEESASMADLMASGGIPPPSNGKPAPPFRPGSAPGQSGSPSGIRGPRMIMQERAAREARQRAEAEAQQRERAEQEARILEQARRAEEQRRSASGIAGGQGIDTEARQSMNPQRQAQTAPDNTSARPRANTTGQAPQNRTNRSGTTNQPPPQTFTGPAPGTQPNFTAQGAESGNQGGTGGSKPRNSFPHAFERWETLSAHWEGLTSYWIRKLEQNKDEMNRDPLNQQLARQVTDLSAAGANLFHAVVELQRLRASSERKFQRWFFETRTELERAQEVNAMLEAALDQERQGRANAIRDAVENERGTSKAQKQLAEMRKELSISKEEARRAWEELGRREQEERDRTLSLQSGQPTIVGGVQVVPMTQGGSRHHNSRAQGAYQTEYGSGYPPEATSSPQHQPPATSANSQYRQQGLQAPMSEGGYSEGEYVIDANGNFLLDAQGNKIPFAAPPSTYSGSDAEAEEYATPATTVPPSGKQDSPSTSTGGGSGGNGGQWTGTHPEPQDYTGQGYGTPGWETVPRHHHPTRLSDVMEEEDERSRASTSRV
ncbi:unnamed protein product [Fusarium venenatum]|uniref:Uncharacterized protein n=1 Tax=Fusarium venenatum TaxID=56646 RepID=A0A2L2T0B3_9HYPO|nr:LOW QUALITY PROTEIN: uncharacterized protein FVRRES_05209 [Fusarium venenatum]CEI60773.1 unnamed protein product [Fusarium venenatum]